MAGTNELRIVLLGKTGLGKSSSGNTILNDNRFRVSISPRSVTQETQMETTNINGRSVTVIDTPGFLNTEITEEKLRRALVTCSVECAPGPHAFLIVLKAQLYTEEEKKAIQEIKQVYGENVLRYAVVLFTHADQLRKHKKSIKEFVEEDEDLKRLIGECGGRYHAFNNDEMEDRTQVEELLRKIDAMVMNNACYTNEMLQAIPVIHNREDNLSFIERLFKIFFN